MTREEAIKEIKMWGIEAPRQKEVLEALIPELRESEDEDERIRMALVEHFAPPVPFTEVRGIPVQKVRDWLERQKPSFRQIHDSVMWDNGLRTGIELGKQKEQTLVTNNEQQECPYKDLVLVKNFFGEYKRKCKLSNKACDSKECEQWNELQDEFKRINEAFEDGKNEVINHPEAFGLQKPAEPSGKLSREEYLYQLLIDQLITYSDYEYLTGKNPVWSVEDKAFLKVAIAICNKYSHKDTADWLKSLPERFNLQPKVEWSEEDIKKIRSEEYTKGFNDAAFGGKLKEWSKEDENMAYFVNQFLEYHENADPTAKSCKKWFNNRFKSLKPHWKPSEEQMEELNKACRFIPYNCDVIAELYEQLLKAYERGLSA